MKRFNFNLKTMKKLSLFSATVDTLVTVD